MARSKSNVVMKGASGKVGDMLVFRQRAGSTIIAGVPRTNPSRVPTENEKRLRRRFRAALGYVLRVKQNAELLARYNALVKPGQTVRNVIMKDYLKDAVLESMDASQYLGVVGDILRLEVSDVLQVMAVRVSISDADGNFVEEGDAVATDDSHNEWIYTATVTNELVSGSRVAVRLIDTPGNTATPDAVTLD